MGLTRQIVYAGDFHEKAMLARKTWGRTDLYSTGDGKLDTYLGGGFGRQNGYEIVLLYGQTGVGKSTVGLNMIAPAISEGIKIGLLILEDDMPDVNNRLLDILGKEKYLEMVVNSQNILCLPEEAMTKSWNLQDLLTYIEDWFTDLNVDLILLDHLQFAFENAEMAKQENEYIAQRIFMQKLNQLMKRLNKTIILVSHVNKAHGSKGMDKIIGSGAIAQAATKVIEVADSDVQNEIEINMRKSRFTKKPTMGWCMKLIDSKIGSN